MTEQLIEADPQIKEKHWQQQIESWEKSHLAKAEYCRRNGLKSSQFLYWKTKLRRSPKSNIFLSRSRFNQSMKAGSRRFPY